MANEHAEAARALLDALLKHRRNFIDGWFANPGLEQSWDTFARLQTTIETLGKVEAEEKSLQ